MNGISVGQPMLVDSCMPRRISPPPSVGTLPPDVGCSVARAAASEIKKLAESLEADPNNPRALAAIEEFARLARTAVTMNTLDPSLLNGNYNGGQLGAYSVNTWNPGVLAPAPPSETFGATSIRELVTALGKKKPEDVVAAIAEAERSNLHDVAAALRKQLGVTEPASAKPVATPVKHKRPRRVK